MSEPLRRARGFSGPWKARPCSLYWSDGQANGRRPIRTSADWNWSTKHSETGVVTATPPPKAGSYWTDSKANAFLDNRSHNPRLADREKNHALRDSGTLPPAKYPRVKGGPHQAWIDAIKGLIPDTGSNFEYAARLTEIDLLGVLAQRFGGRIDWDAAKIKITNRPERNAHLKEPVRRGWDYGEDLSKT